DYYQAQKAVLNTGIGSTATMVIGFDESLDERMSHLAMLRDFQDEQIKKSGHHMALKSFLCWTYKPDNTELGGQEISVEEYCRWLAICRIYLDNVTHVRTSVLTQNERALDAIAFGADDFDLPTEDEVTQSAGATISHQFDNILSYGESLGFQLHKRAPWRHSH
ncbi:MAG: radical SAM protein, partial [Proteobacteria bacterium]|nr:radical SAM protein [Pseudomonadota bacterium]